MYVCILDGYTEIGAHGGRVSVIWSDEGILSDRSNAYDKMMKEKERDRQTVM